MHGRVKFHLPHLRDCPSTCNTQQCALACVCSILLHGLQEGQHSSRYALFTIKHQLFYKLEAWYSCQPGTPERCWPSVRLQIILCEHARRRLAAMRRLRCCSRWAQIWWVSSQCPLCCAGCWARATPLSAWRPARCCAPSCAPS